jgi:hypothetical protein
MFQALMLLLLLLLLHLMMLLLFGHWSLDARAQPCSLAR